MDNVAASATRSSSLSITVAASALNQVEDKSGCLPSTVTTLVLDKVTTEPFAVTLSITTISPILTGVLPILMAYLLTVILPFPLNVTTVVPSETTRPSASPDPL